MLRLPARPSASDENIPLASGPNILPSDKEAKNVIDLDSPK